jgi:hypothetical protein
MKPLSEIVLGALPKFEDAPTVKEMAARIGYNQPRVKAAFEELEASGRAKIVRRGRGLHLVPGDYPGRICVVCRAEFDPLPTGQGAARRRPSKRVTCSNSCRAALQWKDPESAARRIESIRVERRTPEARARATAINNKRWADPEQHERLSEQNRKRWRDPVTRMKFAVEHQRRMSTPEAKQRQSEQIKARWDTPEGRAKLQEGTKRGKNTPEAKAKFSASLKARWQDPELRPKYMAATKRNAAKAREANMRRRAEREEHEKMLGDVGGRVDMPEQISDSPPVPIAVPVQPSR